MPHAPSGHHGGALPCVGVGGINIQTEMLTLSEILSEAHKVATS